MGKDPAPGRPVNIELYSVFGSSDAANWIKLAEIYEQIQSEVGIKITYAPSPNSSGGDNPKLFTAIAGNNAPDLAHITPFSTPQWVELGIMTDLTPYFERDGLTASDFWPVEWHDMTYKGKVWQVNWDTDPNFPFFWNKDLFEKSGLDPDKPPQTIDEVDEYSKKINRVSGGNVIQIGLIPWSVYGYANAMFTWGWAFGGEFYDEEKREVTPDNEYVVKALEWMVNYAQSVGGADRVEYPATKRGAARLRYWYGRYGPARLRQSPRHDTGCSKPAYGCYAAALSGPWRHTARHWSLARRLEPVYP